MPERLNRVDAVDAVFVPMREGIMSAELRVRSLALLFTVSRCKSFSLRK
jgi:hypothetical protein